MTKKKNKKDKDKKKKAAPPDPQAAPAGPAPPRPRWKPSMTVMQALPFVKALSITGAGSTNTMIETLLEEWNALETIDRIYATVDLPPKNIRERQDAVKEAATRAVSKQYRRASISVHPDRFGDTYLAQFNELKAAYEVLRNYDSRRDYMEKMFGVIQAVEASGGTEKSPMVSSAHDTWVNDHSVKTEQDTAQARYQRQQAEAQQARVREQFLIEAAVLQRSPGMLHIYSVNEASRQVKAGIEFSEFDVFQTLCNSVVVQAYPSGEEDKLQRIKVLRGDALESALAQAKKMSKVLPVELVMPDVGYWELEWLARYEDAATGEMRVTPKTHPRRVEIISPAMRVAMRERPALVELARKQAATIKSELAHLHSHQKMSNDELETRYWKMHTHISKGRSTARRLHVAMETLLLDPYKCKDLMALTGLLDEGTIARANLDDIIATNQKRGALKSFKQSVAALIDQGEATDWITTVSTEELEKLGGEANRLYQLLIEGKKANSLLLDPATLLEAAERADLFSEKQRQTLQERSTEVEAQLVSETERLVKEEEERKTAEKARADMEARAKLMPRGQVVQLVGLQNRPDLNLSLGYYMGVGAGDRYVIQLAGSQKEVALRKQNFEKWSGTPTVSTTNYAADEENTVENAGPVVKPAPTVTVEENATNKPWICKHCAFFHEGAVASAATCDMCGAPREAYDQTTPLTNANSGASQPHQASAPAAQKEKVGPAAATMAKRVPVGQRAKTPAAAVPAVPAMTKDVSVKKMKPVETIFIKQQDVSIFIGGGGVNVKRLKAETGVKGIHVQDAHARPDGMVPVRIEGKPVCVRKAVEYVEQRYNTGSQSKPSVPAASNPNTAATRPTPVPAPQAQPTNAPAGLAATFQQKAVISTPAASTSSKPKKAISPLLAFVKDHHDCFRVPEGAFYKFLCSQDISTLEDLQEAVQDDDFLKEMQENGLKGFKKKVFKKAVVAAAAGSNEAAAGGQLNGVVAGKELPMKSQSVEGPRELYCPITLELMVNDPVVAGDTVTYERSAIESWFARNGASGEVLSPITHEPLPNLDLLPNNAVRNMAREYAQKTSRG